MILLKLHIWQKHQLSQDQKKYQSLVAEQKIGVFVVVEVEVLWEILIYAEFVFENSQIWECCQEFGNQAGKKKYGSNFKYDNNDEKC